MRFFAIEWYLPALVFVPPVELEEGEDDEDVTAVPVFELEEDETAVEELEEELFGSELLIGTLSAEDLRAGN